ncbi:MAG: TetR/AcrR family transcriptional regulator [Deltaproteobacteria bacterium]|nr:MAG: TetR/AcrR family transcriptional regulator [Deltaproteobacteria bacterium]
MSSKREKRRDQLIALGVQLFANKPYDEVVIEDLAAAAGASKGLLYHYFGSKKAFYLACVRMVTNRLVAEIESIDTDDPVGAVETGLHRFLDFLERHGQVYRSLMIGASGGDLGVHELFDETRGVIAAMLLDELGVPPDHALYRSTARAWIGSVEAAALDRLQHGDPDRDAFVSMQARALADRLLHVHRLDPGAASPRAIDAARSALSR